MEQFHQYDTTEWGEWFDCYFGSYDDDFTFMMGLARTAKGPVLEAGCGTGRLLLPMLQEGIDARGFDISKPLLDRLKAKAKAQGIDKPPVKQASMLDFKYKERFDRILIAFRTFNHCPNPDAQLQCLRNCYKHLRPGGQLIIATFIPHPDTIVQADNSLKVTGAVENPETGEPVLISHYVAEIDSLMQVRTDVWIIEELQPPKGQAPRRMFLPVTLRWVHPSEMSLLLRLAGFEQAEVVGDFDWGPLDSGCDEQIWIATKKG
ncbi:class I SAM-dependent methyltransferase [Candidatus Sumerlaeota bacterium]|nr:class I SAM-dependent methyltransferase [Candidatus Sumerlaeota bacterium]